jgi:hypothetical protein
VLLTAIVLVLSAWIYEGRASGEFVPAPENPDSPYGYDPRIDLPKDPRMANRPFLGLGIRFTKMYGALVNNINPGPMEGNMERSPYCDRGDIVESIDGEPMTRDTLKKVVSSKKPGDTVTIRFIRTNPEVGSMLPAPGKERNPSEAVITLGRMSEWTGPSADLLKESELPDLDRMVLNVEGITEAEEFLTENLRRNGILEPVDRLRQTFWQGFGRPSYSRNMLPQVAYALKHPFRAVELQETVMQPIRELPGDPMALYQVMARNLNLNVPATGPGLHLEDPERGLDILSEIVVRVDDLMDKAFSRFNLRQKDRLRSFTYGMLGHLSRHEWIMRLPGPEPSIAVMQASTQVDLHSLIQAACLFSGAITKGAPPPKRPPATETYEIRSHVKGEIFAARKVNGHWIVYGGFGENWYDMDHIDVVIDPGGDDRYIYNNPMNRGLKVIVDMQGNDLHAPVQRTDGRQDGGGPAAGLLGVSLIVDYEGNDTYIQHTLGGLGAGIFGVGVLIDYQGQDQYIGGSWSIGAGLYGAGAVLDLGEEADVYRSVSCSQGLGSSRGFGLLLDKGGRDLYQTGGIQSSYGVHGASLSLSQGVGLGIAGYDVGGLGVLCDLGGHDRYLGGEFSQGCGYGKGCGILYDRSGNDLYYADRYSQGSAAHQALGVLVDEGGEDSYYAMSEVSQGGGWDVSIGVLLDRRGNDSYASSGLCQGGASMQSLGWLIDLGGHDRYSSQNQTCQGCSGENRYHYEETESLSFSWLLDAGGEDAYSQPRRNDSTMAVGFPDAEDPEKSRLHGLFMDISRPITFWDFR